MNSNELRKIFLSFFEGKGHTIKPSFSLIPGGSDAAFHGRGHGPVQELFPRKSTADIYPRGDFAKVHQDE